MPAEAETDSWFVTSIPWQDGMAILVDGEKATVEKVNTAFVGARIPAGTHEIEVRFCPPGKKAGLAMSAAGIGVLILCPVRDRRKKKRNRSAG